MTAQMESSFLSRVCRIVVVGHNPDGHRHVAQELAPEGFEVLYRHPEELSAVLESDWIDMVLLDPTIPKPTAIALCRLVRRRSRRALVPILVINEQVTEEGRIDTLKAGADDFLDMNLRQSAVIGRLKTLIRRHAAMEEACGGVRPLDDVIQLGGLTIKMEAYEVLVNGNQVHLSLGEFRLLAFLASRPGTALTRDQIVRALEGDAAEIGEDSSGRALDTRVYSLRRRLGTLGRYVRTVRGVGFKLEVN
jgi:DNA-binding response OmpR family regulator